MEAEVSYKLGKFAKSPAKLGSLAIGLALKHFQFSLCMAHGSVDNGIS